MRRVSFSVSQLHQNPNYLAWCNTRFKKTSCFYLPKWSFRLPNLRHKKALLDEHVERLLNTVGLLRISALFEWRKDLPRDLKRDIKDIKEPIYSTNEIIERLGYICGINPCHGGLLYHKLLGPRLQILRETHNEGVL